MDSFGGKMQLREVHHLLIAAVGFLASSLVILVSSANVIKRNHSSSLSLSKLKKESPSHVSMPLTVSMETGLDLNLSADRIFQQMMYSCCALGRDFSSFAVVPSASCDNFSHPILNVPIEFQDICVMTVEICCNQQKLQDKCQMGTKAAEEGQVCQPYDKNNKEDDVYKDCCLGCKLGLSLSSCLMSMGAIVNCIEWSGNFSGYFKQSFLQCCEMSSCHTNPDCRQIDEHSNHNEHIHSTTFYMSNDVDECSDGSHSCSPDETCLSTYGGFLCHKKKIDTMNEAEEPCGDGFELNGSGHCQDVNECSKGIHKCLSTQRCINTQGSFRCVRMSTCGTGYTLDHDTGICEDNDECWDNSHNCDTLGPSYKCRNTKGSFRCEKVQCSTGEILNEVEGKCEYLQCQDGFEPGPLPGMCVYINKCENETEICSKQCQDSPNGCASHCEDGFVYEEHSESCIDMDECLLYSDICIGGMYCINTLGSYRCECQNGYEEINGQCEDTDECQNGSLVCGESECQNTPGSYRCVCKPGFRPQDEENYSLSSPQIPTCVDINECAIIRDACDQQCINLLGSYRCSCFNGYKLANDGRTCIDIDECDKNNGVSPCRGNCLNEFGSYRCTCPQGYILSNDQMGCLDIDECAFSNSTLCRGQYSYCFNTRGGYKCMDVSCPLFYEPDPIRKHRCRLSIDASRQCHPSDMECTRRPASLSYNFISLVSNLTVPNNIRGVQLFTMQSTSHYSLETKFTLIVDNVLAANELIKANRSHFRLTSPSPHRSVVSIIKSLQGPQDIKLKLIMNLYHLGLFQASALANIHVTVSAHEF